MADSKLISSDGHLNDPPAARERVQREYGDRAPRVVKDPPGQEGLWLFADNLKPSPCCNPSVGFLVAKPEGVSGMDVDQVSDEAIYGEDNFMWSSDYPHAACTWPYSQQIVDRMCAGVDHVVKRKLCRDNANRLFNLGLS